MISPLTILSPEQGKFDPRKRISGVDADLADAAAKAGALGRPPVPSLMQRLFARLHPAGWRVHFSAVIARASLPGRRGAPTAMKTAP